MIRSALVAFLMTGAAYAQSFEVVSVKPSPASAGSPLPSVAKIDNAGVRLRMPLQKVVCLAYGVRADQVAGPVWLGTTSFEIEAKLPGGATEAQIPAMLQNLLADRFKMTAHREPRQRPVFALVVAKNGLKMKPKAIDGETPLSPPCVANAFEGPGIAVAGDRKITSGTDGARTEMSRISTLVDYASLFTDRPVIDKTDLQGGYAIRISIPLSEGSPSDPVGAIDPVILSALDKLGLKLEAQLAPVETVVIDHVERTPSAD